MPNTAALADDLILALSRRDQIHCLSSWVSGFDEAHAYRIARAVTARRVAQGESVVGRKIGFTNRTIWDEYGVHRPLYGAMYDTTVHDVVGAGAASLKAYVEPRIEPEIVLGLSAPPETGMDEAALMGCVGWVAHGFEIVQSLYAGWRFTFEDCVAAFGLHGGLLVGPCVAIAPGEHAAWLERLGRFSIRLSRNGQEIDVGQAGNVLGGPVSALRHLVEVIALDPEAAPLMAGEMVTTGTVTRAFPVMAGERWTTTLKGLDLPGMDVTFV